MLAGYVMLGELSLRGTIAAVAGALPAAISDGAWAATAVAR
jgi:magnesium chelatase family protein